MQVDEFEWDERKAAENYAKHGIDFEHAKLVFNDIFAVEGCDDSVTYGEVASPFLASQKVSSYSLFIPSALTTSA